MLPLGARTPSLVQAYRFIFHPVSHVRAMQQKYGDAVRFHSAVGKGVALMDPSMVREVFAAPPDAVWTRSRARTSRWDPRAAYGFA
jgi:hypothetical protein